MKEQDTIRIFPWTLSSTGSWSEETGLLYLRDLPVDELVGILWENGAHVQNTGIMEIIDHGNLRRAAKLTRQLVELHPICEASIREGFGPFADILLSVDPDKLASKPEEYPSSVNIIYIQ